VREVALPIGLVTFDGRVLEFFGFGEQGSRRFHVSQIQRIELGGSMLSLDVGPGGVGMKLAIRLDDAERAQLGELVDEVRRATA
jgi:hypothetical protein